MVTRGLTFPGDALAHSLLPGVAVAFLRTGSAGHALLADGIVSARVIGVQVAEGALC